MGIRVTMVGAVALCTFAFWARPVVACSTCSAGDPTLMLMGQEVPRLGAVRLFSAFSYRTERTGVPAQSELKTTEQRLSMSVAAAPWDRLLFAVTVPVVRREVRHVNGAKDRILNLADVELRARFTVYSDRSFAARHILAVHGGLEFPTAPSLRSQDGELLALEAQPGTGSFDPFFGLSYVFRLDDRWSFRASSTLLVPTYGRLDARVGTTLVSTLGAQLQPWETFGFFVDFDSRWDGKTVESGQPDPHSGGFLLLSSPGVVWSFGQGLQWQATILIPTIKALHGEHDEGIGFETGISFDI